MFKLVFGCLNLGEVWDPRAHGPPFWYKITGMPSMWFTSQEAHDRLERFVQKANPGYHAVSIFPEELALYALSGDDERNELQIGVSWVPDPWVPDEGVPTGRSENGF